MSSPAPEASIPTRARRLFRKYRRITLDTVRTVIAVFGFLGERHVSLLAAGLAFFALISLAPFVILAVAIGGAIFGREATHEELRLQIGDDLGPQVTEFVLSLAQGATNHVSLSVASFFGLLVLFWSSTRLFAEVRDALHAIWGLPKAPDTNLRHAVLLYLKGRLFAAISTVFFGAVFLLLLASRLIVTTVFGLRPGQTPLSIPYGIWSVVEYLFAVTLLTLVVHAVYRVLPERGPRGKALLVGSLVTALLLLVGRSAVGLYVSVGAIGSAYGAAAALIIFLIWAYWSALAFLFGARLAFALRQKWRGDEPAPEPEPPERVRA